MLSSAYIRILIIGLSLIISLRTCYTFHLNNKILNLNRKLFINSIETSTKRTTESTTCSEGVLNTGPKKVVETWLDKILIIIASFLLKRITPNLKDDLSFKIGWKTSFDDFVLISKDLLTLPPEDIKIAVICFLSSLIPSKVKNLFREQFAAEPHRVSAQCSQWIGFGFLNWLIGPTEEIRVASVDADGNPSTRVEGVKLKECRYLAESGCKAACLHICRDPTQTFFADELGFPLYMKPNFEDKSCEMRFGVSPPLREDDELYGQPCFTDCNVEYKKKMYKKCS